MTKPVHVLAENLDPALASALAEGCWVPVHLDPTKSLLRRASIDAPGIGLVCLCRVGVGGQRLERLQHILDARPDVDWLAIVSRTTGAQPEVREFIARNCVNYHTAPIDRERLLYALGHAEGMRRLVGNLRSEPGTKVRSPLIIGNSPAMRQLRRDLHRIARVDAPVLITAESGTGKELAALTIHRESPRHAGPFVAVNCAALSPSLIHAELFGFERGAFTGANERKLGQFEAANGGTILLDEIGDLNSELQALLLRVLEERTVRRIGGREPIPLNARVIAATHVDIEAAVCAGRFREDLYYRLNVLRVGIVPLRERKDDIAELAHTFLEKYSTENPQRLSGFSNSALAVLEAYDWPGNVRELLNRVRRAVILANGRLITARDLQFGTVSPSASVPNLETVRTNAERQAVVASLSHTAWNASKAAALLGVSRASFYRLLEKHALRAIEATAPLA